MAKYKDLTGYKSGLLTAIQPIRNSGGPNKHIRWLCLCQCGNYCEVESGHLTNKNRPIKSCGCFKKTKCSTNLNDITGHKFGLLTVLEREHENARKGKHVKWLCECECGNRKYVDGSDLRKRHIISCGCKNLSSGEIQVRDILLKFGIEFEMQYELKDLLTEKKGHPRIDFAIKRNEQIVAFIQFQGEQHYKDCGFFGKQAREQTDKMKKDYCSMINIQLFEIKWNEDVDSSVAKILSTLMLIPCQASKEEGVTTIP